MTFQPTVYLVRGARGCVAHVYTSTISHGGRGTCAMNCANCFAGFKELSSRVVRKEKSLTYQARMIVRSSSEYDRGQAEKQAAIAH